FGRGDDLLNGEDRFDQFGGAHPGLKAFDQPAPDAAQTNQMRPQVGESRLVAIRYLAHIVKVQLLELVQQPVGEPSRLGQAGQVALLVQPFGLPDLAVGRRQWSCYAVGSLRRISPARQRYLVTPLPSTSGLGVF